MNSAPTGLYITADHLLSTSGLIHDAAMIADGDGVILAVGAANTLPRSPDLEHRHYTGLMLPGAVNTHSHAFQILLRGKSDAARDFRDWVDNYMYALALSADSEDLRLGAELAFAEMLRNGITTVGEFFYVHNGPAAPACADLGNENALLTVAAARRCGLRIHLLRTVYDRAARHGQQRFYEPATTAVERTRELALATSDMADVTVGIAPHSLHGASADGIQAAAEYAAETGQPFQIHIAEEEHDLAFARAEYGTTPGRALEKLGVVSDRLVVVHGCWLDTEEIEMLGNARAGCAYNPISNMALGDGITDTEAMVRAGVTIGLGCDGPCANHQVNLWQEARFAEWLQRVDKRRMNVLGPAAADHAETVNYPFEMATSNGGHVLGIPVGKLAPGYWADAVVVDPHDLSLLPHHNLDPAALLNNVVNSMAARGAVRDVIVGGDEVMRDGRLTRIDEAELAARGAAWQFGEA
ncbi:MAG: amidohydrolase family protein [Acidobacteria bacterium]|nr:amidohydrolase family protein [Acidobacteriota bacterium]